MHNCRTTAAALVVFAALGGATGTQTRTWVSNSGSDLNPCTTVRPCATFTGALAKTAPYGEIDVLNPGDYGTVTISQSVTIDGGGIGTITVPSGANGIFVTGGSTTDAVTIRNLTLNGVASGSSPAALTGINWTGVGSQLKIQGVSISTVQFGMNLSPSATPNISIQDTKISNCKGGVFIAPSLIFVTIVNLSVVNCGDGIYIDSINGPHLEIIQSSFAGSQSLSGLSGVSAGGFSGAGVYLDGAATVTLTNTSVMDFGYGVYTVTTSSNTSSISLNRTVMTVGDGAKCGGAGTSNLYSYGNNVITASAYSIGCTAQTATYQ